jgi:hypothetical protein
LQGPGGWYCVSLVRDLESRLHDKEEAFLSSLRCLSKRD